MFVPLLIMLGLPDAAPSAPNPDRFAAAPALAAKIDGFAQAHWTEDKVQPAPVVADAAFLRRLTLDLVGRIPTYQEARTFSQDRSPDKRQQAVRRLMESPEYALHLGRVLDDMIQESQAGDPEFLEYLRSSVAAHKPWDQVFREIIVGPWDAPEVKRASRFLTKRVRNLDDLTNDTARVFFGVNVSCAKCHDHPLVSDWKQDHYYGMASFFNPTYEGSKGKRDQVQEKATAPVSFVTTRGERRTAKLMFLSSQVIEDPGDRVAPKAAMVSRREQLVKAGLEEKTFFRRAIVNRLWAYFMGRGLVHPVDQMHSANPPTIPEVLEWLADDFADRGYDLDRIIAALVSSKVYQLSSARSGSATDAGAKHFAVASLRSLTPQQYAVSILLASGDGSFDSPVQPDARARRYRDLEGQSGKLTSPRLIDPRTDRFQSSAGEALFMSNNEEIQRLLVPAGKNLTARLAALADNKEVVETATWTILSRPPEAEEQTYLARWIDEHKEDRGRACSQLVWALIASAEFRFNY
jgi:hypothetical protein